MRVHVATAPDMERLGGELAKGSRPGDCLHIQGELGAGKTTLVRGFLHGLGFPDAVKSPTYPLMEPYEVAGLTVIHFDLYRVGDPGELENLGYRDCFDGASICLVEWPERAAGRLGAPDLHARIAIAGDGRDLDLEARSRRGQDWLAPLGTT